MISRFIRPRSAALQLERSCVFLLGLFTLLLFISNRRGDTAEILTEPTALWLKTAENTLPIRPVNFKFVVTYYDPAWKVLWVQQGDRSAYLFSGTNALPFQSGDRVLVRGFTVRDRPEIDWPAAQVIVLDSPAWGEPRVLTNTAPALIPRESIWVDLEGYVTITLALFALHLAE